MRAHILQQDLGLFLIIPLAAVIQMGLSMTDVQSSVLTKSGSPKAQTKSQWIVESRHPRLSLPPHSHHPWMCQ